MPLIYRKSFKRKRGCPFETASSSESFREITSVINGEEPWLLNSSVELALVRRLEELFPTLENAKCKVGIGVATGADKAFIGDISKMDVEESRKLPLAMSRDIVHGKISWKGKGVINPYNDKGGLVDLDEYPRLKRYLEERKAVIAVRHCVQKSPKSWYKTIDRIYPSLTRTEKLLIPDIKGNANIAYDRGEYYPHHNLYYIVSESWDLKALQAILSSGIATLFVSAYSTQMRGGYLRFQAQYLRRICIPNWEQIPEEQKSRLFQAIQKGDKSLIDQVVYSIYGLTDEEQKYLMEIN